MNYSRVNPKRGIHLLVLALVCLPILPTAVAQQKEVRRVLILNELGLASPVIDLIDNAIRADLERSPYQIELYSENLETTLFPDPVTQQEFRKWYVHKYRDRKPDVIIAVGPSAIDFLSSAHEKSFSGVPVVFCGSTAEMANHPDLGPQFTGVWEVLNPTEVLETALKLQPNTKHVFVVGGTAAFDKQIEEILKQGLRGYESQFEFTYLTNLEMSTLLKRLRDLPKDSIILFAGISEDASGTHYIEATQSTPMITAIANAPVFNTGDMEMGQGVVGGYLVSFYKEAKIAAADTVSLLSGEKPESIPVVNGANVYEFDWRALRKWNLKEANLPPGSIVVNRQPTVWETYKWYIIGGISLIVLESLLIGALLWQRVKRRKAEDEVEEAYQAALESEKRFRLVANNAPVVIWMTDRDKLCNYVNQQWLDFTGRQMEDELGNGWAGAVHSDDLKKTMDTYVNAFDRQESFTMEYRLRHKSGDYRWILATGVPRFNADGSFAGYIGSAIDVTERKLAEEALANIGGRLIAAQEQERTRIARELHDDINQQLAFLSVMLDQFQQNPPRSISQIRRRVQGFVKQVADASESVQALSHRLHSSKLEYLGLVVAMQSFCREFAAQYHVEVNFSHESVPENVPQEIALCLFRVAQAALVNALKHSGVKSFDVLLHGTKEGVGLVVHDSGVGFDTEQMLKHDGIGLISIRERTRFVNGKLAIHSKPNGGTTIEVEVPLPSELSQSFPSMSESQAGNRAFHQVQ